MKQKGRLSNLTRRVGCREQVEHVSIDNGKRLNAMIHVDERDCNEAKRLLRRSDKVLSVEVAFNANIADIVETVEFEGQKHGIRRGDEFGGCRHGTICRRQW